MISNPNFELEVLPHLDAAYNLARWLSRDGQIADDLVQEAMLRAWRYFGGFRGGDSRAWLLAIVRNVFYTTLSKCVANEDEFDETLHTGDASDDGPEANALRQADAYEIRTALARLPVEFREIIVLREIEGCSYKEIATITEAKIGTVMSRLSRARKRLELELQNAAEKE